VLRHFDRATSRIPQPWRTMLDWAGICGPGDGGNTFVKRLIGLPGEQVSERDGTIFINGKRLGRA
jgi:type IV secretory pathway protease TraF